MLIFISNSFIKTWFKFARTAAVLQGEFPVIALVDKARVDKLAH